MNFQKIFRDKVTRRLDSLPEPGLLTEEDMLHLPPPVQKYLRITGAVGKPRITHIRLVFKGSMKRNLRSGWMPIRSVQYNFFDEPSRFFYIRSKVAGIPFDGLHAYEGTEATMQIRVASMFRVADAKGEKMSRGETVTLFNDMCFMAPSTLVSPDIRWETPEGNRTRAWFTQGPHEISAELEFNEAGELVGFISGDRYLCEDGKTYLSFPWSTPTGNYREVDGRKIPGYGEAVWHLPEGPFCYARFHLEEVEFNPGAFKP